MTHSDLRLQIQDIIRNLTGREFIKPIHIRDLQPEGYAVGFEAIQYQPVWFSATLPDDQFLCFIANELRKAQFLRVEYGKAVRNTTLDHPLNSFVSPYDTTRNDRKDR